MNITGPLVLPEGIVITRAEDLPIELRQQTKALAGEFAISRPRSRTPSRILDAQAVALLKEFETPKTIGQAVAYHSRAVQSDPEKTLEQALPMLTQLVACRLLVSPYSHESEEIRATHDVGATVVGCEVLQCIQAFEDSEIYKVRRPNGEIYALKILRSVHNSEMRHMFDREAAILRHLAGSVSPGLMDEGIWEDRRYLLLEWFSGPDVEMAASSLRTNRGMDSQKRLLTLCCNVLRTYSYLHECEVIHSDVHPRNILVNEAGLIRLLDYGLAQHPNINQQFGTPPRGGIGFFFEPEYAAAARIGVQPPPTTQSSEQYALGALLYFLFTGAHYLEFSLTKDEMMRQISEDPAIPFADRGTVPWPEVEIILARALEKAASKRFPSVDNFAEALEAVVMSERDWIPGAQVGPTQAEDLCARSIARVGFAGELFRSGVTTAPTASVTYGAAGIAYALYRIACQRQDPSLLALADVWCRRALSAEHDDASFYNSRIEITPEIVGLVSPYHTASGIQVVQALVSHARCDVTSQVAALESFVLSSQKPCENPDLALGRSGTLLATSLLLDALGGEDGLNLATLKEFGNSILTSVWCKIDKEPPVREGPGITYLGIAHGWAGILYGALTWSKTSGADLPGEFEERLQQLAALAEPCGESVRWPWALPQKNGGRSSAIYVPGWCNGTAGYVFLWTAAHRAFGDEQYLRLAERAALNTWQCTDSINNLCCGLSGQAYALLNLYKHTGDDLWLQRARELGHRAAIAAQSGYTPPGMPAHSLYKGELGVAVLTADLSAPALARMPFFEVEDWP